MKAAPVLIFMFLFFTQSCSKSELETVGGNNPPPDTSISNSVYRDYINRVYILVLGREPDSAEYSSYFSSLRQNEFSIPSRRQMLDAVFSGNDYRWRRYEKLNTELLNGLDTIDIYAQIQIFDFLLADTTNQAFWPFIQFEKDRLIDLRDAPARYAAGLIHIRELKSLMINNYFYDQINMGSANFIIASFQQFLNRNPTLSEQQSGVSMVDGFSSVLFLKAGSSKDDYLQILFNSRDYFEGSVVRLYRDYLLRSPGSLEMSTAANKYQASLDYESIQKDLLSGDEFAGID